MNQQQQQPTTFLSRIGSLFGRKQHRDLAGNGEGTLELTARPTVPHASQQLMEPRSTFLRPWARRDAAIQHLQDGFTTLTDLMGGIKDNLDKQSERHTELMDYLSHLPKLAQELPEANRMHGETLRAEQGEMLSALHERVESFRQQDQAIADNLTSVGVAMQTVTKNTSTSTQVRPSSAKSSSVPRTTGCG